MDEEDDGAVDINLFGIGQRAAEDENFEDVNMGAEGVTGINLFGIGGDEPSDENNDATDEKNLDQLQQPGTGSDSNDASATDDAQVAATVTATPSDSVASGPLPTPPKAKPGEKVDTSQLDAELAKMKPTDSPQSKQPTANASAASDTDDDATTNASNEDADVSNENADASSDADDDATTGASNEDADVSAASDAESDAQEDDGATAATQPKDNADVKDIDKESEFAENVTNDVHADESAPQTAPISAEPVQPMTVQSVNYQQPDISELKKHPTPEKKTDVYSSIPIEKMPVTLIFETGRQKITLGELEKVKAGYTFECGNPVNAPVTICANDTPIGTGELLDVDGRIGVRIIEFYNK